MRWRGCSNHSRKISRSRGRTSLSLTSRNLKSLNLKSLNLKSLNLKSHSHRSSSGLNPRLRLSYRSKNPNRLSRLWPHSCRAKWSLGGCRALRARIASLISSGIVPFGVGLKRNIHRNLSPIQRPSWTTLPTRDLSPPRSVFKASRLSRRARSRWAAPGSWSEALSLPVLDFYPSSSRPGRLLENCGRRRPPVLAPVPPSRPRPLLFSMCARIPLCGWQGFSRAIQFRELLPPRCARRLLRPDGSRFRPPCRLNYREKLSSSSDACCSGLFGPPVRTGYRRSLKYRLDRSPFRNTRLGWGASKTGYIAPIESDSLPHSAFSVRSRTEPLACQI